VGLGIYYQFQLIKNIGACVDHVTQNKLLFGYGSNSRSWHFPSIHPPNPHSSTRRISPTTTEMASTSNVPRTQVPRSIADKMADDWEKKMTCFIEEDNREGWADAQRGLYEELVSLGHGYGIDALISLFFSRYGFHMRASPTGPKVFTASTST